MRRWAPPAVLALAALAVAAYYAASPPDGAPGDGGGPAPDAAKAPGIPEVNNRLALDIYRLISDNDDNIFFSPPAVYMALSAIYEGAEGATASQIQRLLMLDTDAERRHGAVSEFLSAVHRDYERDHVRRLYYLQQEIDETAIQREGGTTRDHFEYPPPSYMPTRVVHSGALWTPDGRDVRGSYADLVRSVYGIGVGSPTACGKLTTVCSLEDDPYPARSTWNPPSPELIDGWAALETEGRITEMWASPRPREILVTSAARFASEWLYMFKDLVGPHHRPAAWGDPPAEYMDNRWYHARSDAHGMTMIEIQYGSGPYRDPDTGMPLHPDPIIPTPHHVYYHPYLSMLVIMPHGDVREAGSSITMEQIDDLRRGLTAADRTLIIPKFKIEGHYSLREAISLLGAPAAFSPGIGGIAESYGLHVGDVVQKSYIDVTLSGTDAEATEWTGPLFIQRNTTFLPVDRPFIFLIYDNELDAILYMGRVMDPRI